MTRHRYLDAHEREAIKEAVWDFVEWTCAQQRKSMRWSHESFRHPGVESPKINPDYEWLFRRTWEL
jgi:hypothetical protein